MEAIIFTCILIFIVVFILALGIIKSNPIDEDSTDTMSESSQSY